MWRPMTETRPLHQRGIRPLTIVTRASIQARTSLREQQSQFHPHTLSKVLTNMARLLDLPDTCLVLVLAQLPLADRVGISRVCRAFRHLSITGSQSLWQVLQCRMQAARLPSLLQWIAPRVHLAQGSAPRCLTLAVRRLDGAIPAGGWQAVFGQYRQLLQLCGPAVRELSLGWPRPLMLGPWLPAKTPHVTHLSVAAEELIVQSLAGLTALQAMSLSTLLPSDWDLNPAGLRDWLRWEDDNVLPPALTALTLCGNLSAPPSTALLRQGRLARLVLTGTKQLRPSGLAGLARLASVRELEIDSCPRLPDDMWGGALCQLSQLTSLAIRSTYTGFNSWWFQSGWPRPLLGVRSLDISNCNLSQLPSSYFDFAALTHLVLTGNDLLGRLVGKADAQLLLPDLCSLRRLGLDLGQLFHCGALLRRAPALQELSVDARRAPPQRPKRDPGIAFYGVQRLSARPEPWYAHAQRGAGAAVSPELVAALESHTCLHTIAFLAAASEEVEEREEQEQEEEQGYVFGGQEQQQEEEQGYMFGGQEQQQGLGQLPSLDVRLLTFLLFVGRQCPHVQVTFAAQQSGGIDSGGFDEAEVEAESRQPMLEWQL